LVSLRQSLLRVATDAVAVRARRFGSIEAWMLAAIDVSAMPIGEKQYEFKTNAYTVDEGSSVLITLDLGGLVASPRSWKGVDRLAPT
jgi:hypothetical protein